MTKHLLSSREIFEIKAGGMLLSAAQGARRSVGFINPGPTLSPLSQWTVWVHEEIREREFLCTIRNEEIGSDAELMVDSDGRLILSRKAGPTTWKLIHVRENEFELHAPGKQGVLRADGTRARLSKTSAPRLTVQAVGTRNDIPPILRAARPGQDDFQHGPRDPRFIDVRRRDLRLLIVGAFFEDRPPNPASPVAGAEELLGFAHPPVPPTTHTIGPAITISMPEPRGMHALQQHSDRMTFVGTALQQFFRRESGGRCRLEIDVANEWYRIPGSIRSRAFDSIERQQEIIEDISHAGGGNLPNFDNYDIIVSMFPKPEEGGRIRTLRSSASMSIPGRRHITNLGELAWDRAHSEIAHEIGHHLGLVDLLRQGTPAGSFTIMSSPNPEDGRRFLLWNRHLLGWLDPSRVRTIYADDLPTDNDQHLRIPIVPPTHKRGTLMIMIPEGSPSEGSDAAYIIEMRPRRHTEEATLHLKLGIAIYRVASDSRAGSDPVVLETLLETGGEPGFPMPGHGTLLVEVMTHAIDGTAEVEVLLSRRT